MRCFALLALVSVVTVGTSSAFVDAKRRTTITVVGTGCEEWINCDSERWDYSSIYNGCCPEHTLDGDLSTRWSCKEGQEDEPCTLTYHFDDPQDIVMMRIAFHKGNENVRKLKIKINGSTDSVIESSGETLGYQSFMLNTDETQKLSLNPVGLDKDEWISISEVKFMVY